MQNKVVIITGAASGIGLALARAFAVQETRLCLADRAADRLTEVAHELTQRHTNVDVLPVVTDVSIEADCKAMIQACVARFGTIDILINNAGISMRALFKDLDLTVIKRLMDVNFWGTVYCTKYALPSL